MDEDAPAIDPGTNARHLHRAPGPLCGSTPLGVACQESASAPYPAKEKSGPSWVAKFPGSASLDELDASFRPKVKDFIEAIKASGARVSIAATYRPRERAYLMHYSVKIATSKIKAEAVPAMAGVEIDWVHDTDQASIAAAVAMKEAYEIRYPPALVSRHTERGAIDMTVTSIIGKKVKNASGEEIEIKAMTDLHAVGKSYGVIKLVEDEPHWSDDGH